MKLRVTVNGNEYDVDVDILEQSGGAPTAAPVHAAIPAAPRPAHVMPVAAPAPLPHAGAGGANSLKSPIPGTIVEIKVTAGQAVTAGETVLVIDAMKMNTPVGAPITGKVKEILVKSGDPVKMGQTLIVFE